MPKKPEKYDHKFRKRHKVVEARQFQGGLKDATRMMKWLKFTDVEASYQPRMVISNEISPEQIILNLNMEMSRGPWRLRKGEWVVFPDGRNPLRGPSFIIMSDADFNHEYIGYTP